MGEQKHKEVIGGSLPLILSNIQKLIASQVAVKIHLPIIPGFNDSPENMASYVEFLGQFLKKLSGVDILPYHSYGAGKYALLGLDYKLDGVEDLPGHQVMPLARALKEKGLRQVTVRGLG